MATKIFSAIKILASIAFILGATIVGDMTYGNLGAVVGFILSSIILLAIVSVVENGIDE